jgi:DNA modification methylase
VSDDHGKPWPASEIERRTTSKLVPYARNARKHSADQVKQIAASIREWGWTTPILVDEDDNIIAGHGRLLAAQQLGIDEVPAMVARGWTQAQKRAYIIADNQLTLNGSWDSELLSVEIGELADLDFDLDLLGFDSDTLDGMLGKEDDDAPADLDGADEALPAVELEAVSRRGDLWLLGDHRVLCGDSTDPDAVELVMDGQPADMIHADPPYGMGKEADGVANDNLYREKLDAFQLDWLRLALQHARENVGLYIWGQAPDLWRLWYAAGLHELDDLVIRNELVWAKGNAFGIGGVGAHSYPPETERCLFLMRGTQFLGNINKDDYYEGYEPLRQWLREQFKAMHWKAADVRRITGTQMSGHWTGKSQFLVIGRKHYDKLRAEANGTAFAMTYDEMIAEFDGGYDHRRKLAAEMREKRSYFDATKDNATDVWTFKRVVGEERFGHATPKPAQMIGRAVFTSCPSEGLVLEPFLGTGTTLIAAEANGRRCFGLELEPRYVDVVVRRWQDWTGKQATRLDGVLFDDVAAQPARA